MASFARSTKRNYDEMYDQILKSITCVEDLTPTMISQRIQNNIQDFFAAIYKQLKDIEKDVLTQVKASLKLKDLASLIESLHLQFDEELLKKLENEKFILDDKVDRARYGYIVTRKDYYKQLIKEMEEFSFNLSYKIDQSSAMFSDLLQIEIDRQAIYERLYELVEGTIKIDGGNFQRKAPPPPQ